MERLTHLLPIPLQALVQLLVFVLVGRVVLAWLPAGRLGSHAPRELPATLAASLVLDWALTHAASGMSRVLGLPPTAFRAFLPLVAVAALVRWLTLPAGFVPTPPPRVPPAPPLITGIAWTCALALLVYFLVPVDGDGTAPASLTRSLVTAITLLALPALLDHALRELEVRAGARLIVWIAPAIVLGVMPRSLIDTVDGARTPLLFGAGVAFAVVARKRADRRAFAFSAISFGSMATLVAGWPLAVAGLVGLMLFGPGASLLQRAGWPLAAAILFAPIAWPMIQFRPAGPAYFAAVAIPLVLFALPAFFARGWRTVRT